MKTLYFECGMGAAGDMLMAALFELHSSPEDFLKRLNHVLFPNVTVEAEPSVKCGIKGTHMRVIINGKEEESCMEEGENGNHGQEEEHHGDLHHGCGGQEKEHHGHTHHDHEEQEHQEHHHGHPHHHNTYQDIEHFIGHLDLSETVKKNALEVYKLIAEAESHVHGIPVHQIHFHEVGEMDAIADIIGVCMLMEEINPAVVTASPVNTGSGQIRCAHGILPVPAPAAAEILQNIPIYSDNIRGELCTPTGAALLKHFVDKFDKMPVTAVEHIGYGMGKKDFEKANCVRAFLGGTGSGGEETAAELICNLDDMTPEAIAFAQQILLDEGALDVYTSPIGMKKGRAALSFTCMCRLKDREKMLSLIFRHTSTLGIREYICRRYTLQREHTEIETEFGRVRVKTSRGFGAEKSKPEYEDIAKIAREKGMSLQDVINILKV